MPLTLGIRVVVSPDRCTRIVRALAATGEYPYYPIDTTTIGVGTGTERFRQLVPVKKCIVPLYVWRRL